jgi:hypothetical protein
VTHHAALNPEDVERWLNREQNEMAMQEASLREYQMRNRIRRQARAERSPPLTREQAGRPGKERWSRMARKDDYERTVGV